MSKLFKEKLELLMIEKVSRLVLATGNKNKVVEFRGMLDLLQVEVIAQNDLYIHSVCEVGKTFMENALLKAENVASKIDLPVLADDSGLEVDALGGDPGVFSARFAGDKATDRDNNRKLLRLMSNVKKRDRSARFRCALVYVRYANDPKPMVFETTWEGEILDHQEGGGGFGYDSLFFIPSENCTAAQLSSERKNQISHRAKALHLMVEALKKYFIV